jgi:hypothetical protein
MVRHACAEPQQQQFSRSHPHSLRGREEREEEIQRKRHDRGALAFLLLCLLSRILSLLFFYILLFFLLATRGGRSDGRWDIRLIARLFLPSCVLLRRGRFRVRGGRTGDRDGRFRGRTELSKGRSLALLFWPH